MQTQSFFLSLLLPCLSICKSSQDEASIIQPFIFKACDICPAVTITDLFQPITSVYAPALPARTTHFIAPFKDWVFAETKTVTYYEYYNNGREYRHHPYYQIWGAENQYDIQYYYGPPFVTTMSRYFPYPTNFVYDDGGIDITINVNNAPTVITYSQTTSTITETVTITITQSGSIQSAIVTSTAPAASASASSGPVRIATPISNPFQILIRSDNPSYDGQYIAKFGNIFTLRDQRSGTLFVIDSLSHLFVAVGGLQVDIRFDYAQPLSKRSTSNLNDKFHRKRQSPNISFFNLLTEFGEGVSTFINATLNFNRQVDGQINITDQLTGDAFILVAHVIGPNETRVVVVQDGTPLPAGFTKINIIAQDFTGSSSSSSSSSLTLSSTELDESVTSLSTQSSVLQISTSSGTSEEALVSASSNETTESMSQTETSELSSSEGSSSTGNPMDTSSNESASVPVSQESSTASEISSSDLESSSLSSSASAAATTTTTDFESSSIRSSTTTSAASSSSSSPAAIVEKRIRILTAQGVLTNFVYIDKNGRLTDSANNVASVAPVFKFLINDNGNQKLRNVNYQSDFQLGDLEISDPSQSRLIELISGYPRDNGSRNGPASTIWTVTPNFIVSLISGGNTGYFCQMIGSFCGGDPPEGNHLYVFFDQTKYNTYCQSKITLVTEDYNF